MLLCKCFCFYRFAERTGVDVSKIILFPALTIPMFSISFYQKHLLNRHSSTSLPIFFQGTPASKRGTGHWMRKSFLLQDNLKSFPTLKGDDSLTCFSIKYSLAKVTVIHFSTCPLDNVIMLLTVIKYESFSLSIQPSPYFPVCFLFISLNFRTMF